MSVEDLVEGARALVGFELLRQRLAKTVIVTPPAAGAEWSQTVPPGELWEVMGISATLLTSAVVANRHAQLTLSDPNTIWGRIGSLSAQGAGVTIPYSWLRGFAGSAFTASSSFFTNGFPTVYLPSGSIIASSVLSKDVGDQWSAIAMEVIAWNPRSALLAAEWLEDHVR